MNAAAKNSPTILLIEPCWPILYGKPPYGK
jgi:hypothetical protein